MAEKFKDFLQSSLNKNSISDNCINFIKQNFEKLSSDLKNLSENVISINFSNLFPQSSLITKIKDINFFQTKLFIHFMDIQVILLLLELDLILI